MEYDETENTTSMWLLLIDWRMYVHNIKHILLF